MKISCIKEKLQIAVSQVEKVVGKNLTLPILSTIRIEATEKGLVLRSTNLNVGVEVTVPAKTEKTGVVAVDGSLLNNILNQIKKDKNITLETEGGNISITTSHSSMVLKSQDPEEFPSIPKTKSTTEFMVPIERFIDGIKAVSYSAAVSDIRPQISSVYIYEKDGELLFVATDSFRLAEKSIKVKNLPEFTGILIPIKNINDVVKVLSQEKGDMKCVVGENQMAFVGDNFYITTRLIDEIFPEYQQIIPKDFNTDITTLTQDLTQALKVVDIFSDKFNQVDIHIDPKEKECILSSKNEDVGQNKTTLDAAMSGEALDTSINHKHLSDAFFSITTDSVVLKFAEANKPVVVTGVGDTSFTYLIMPLSR